MHSQRQLRWCFTKTWASHGRRWPSNRRRTKISLSPGDTVVKRFRYLAEATLITLYTYYSALIAVLNKISSKYTERGVPRLMFPVPFQQKMSSQEGKLRLIANALHRISKALCHCGRKTKRLMDVKPQPIPTQSEYLRPLFCDFCIVFGYQHSIAHFDDNAVVKMANRRFH